MNITLDVCGRTVTITLSKKQLKRHEAFAETIRQLYKEKEKKRIIIGICGRSGSGKSTLAVLTAKQLKLPEITAVSTDAFHYRNNYLRAHYDGAIPLKERKGRYDTYDTKKLLKKLQQFRRGEDVTLPVYSRTLHEPIENQIRITKKRAVLLIEGNWLLHNSHGWDKVKKELDYCYYLESDAATAKQEVIKRHIEGGRTKRNAVSFYNKSDSKNNKIIDAEKKRADEILKPFYRKQ